jgi:hypothetical protein
MHPFKFSLLSVVLAVAYCPTLAAEVPPHSPELVPVKPVQQAPLHRTTYQQLTGGWNGNATSAGRYEPNGGTIPSPPAAPANLATGRGSGLGNTLNQAARKTGNELARAYDRTFSTSSPGPLKTVQQVTADFIGDTSKQLQSAGAAVTKTTERLVNPPPHPPQTPQATAARQPLAAPPATTTDQLAAPPLNTQPTLSTSGLGDAGFNPFANRRPATNSQIPATKWNMGSGGTGGVAFPANGPPSNLHQAGELPTVATPPPVVTPTAPQLAPVGLVNVTPVDRQNKTVAGSNSFTNSSRWPSPAGQPQPAPSIAAQTPSATAFNNAPPLTGFNNGSRNYGSGQPPLTPIPNPGPYRDASLFQPAGLNPTGPPPLPQQHWIPLIMTGIGLMGSLGANLFLGFSYLDVRYKYLSAIRRGTRPLRRTEKGEG